MHKIIDIKMTSVFSPICQTLIYENTLQYSKTYEDECLSNCRELLVVRLDGTVIAYCTFKVINNIQVVVRSLHFRNIIKDHAFAEFWLLRYLKRYLHKKSYSQLLLLN
jgi:hypothetical protein